MADEGTVVAAYETLEQAEQDGGQSDQATLRHGHLRTLTEIGGWRSGVALKQSQYSPVVNTSIRRHAQDGVAKAAADIAGAQRSHAVHTSVPGGAYIAAGEKLHFPGC